MLRHLGLPSPSAGKHVKGSNEDRAGPEICDPSLKGSPAAKESTALAGAFVTGISPETKCTGDASFGFIDLLAYLGKPISTYPAP